MGLREVTGYIAHVLLAGYWVWVVSSTAARLRSPSRTPRLRLQVALVKTAAIAVTAVAVGVIHFWATRWWHVVVTLLVVVPTGTVLRHAYRRLVVAPRHRRALVQRAVIHELAHLGDPLGPRLRPGLRVPARGLHRPATVARHRTAAPVRERPGRSGGLPGAAPGSSTAPW